MEVKKAERKALAIGIIMNLLMAGAGWTVFLMTGMQALLLDGNFSFIAAISCIVGIYITKISSRKSKTFPRGHFMLEPLYAILKQIMILIVLTIATTESINKLISYLRGLPTVSYSMQPVLYYAVIMVALCLGLSLIYNYFYKKSGSLSIILVSEAKSSMVDAAISGGVGIAAGILIIFNHIELLENLGDVFITLVLVVLTIRQPIIILKRGLFELANGVVTDESIKQPIVDIIEKNFPETFALDAYRIRKIGNSFHIDVYAYHRDTLVDINDVRQGREHLYNILCDNYPHIFLNFILK